MVPLDHHELEQITCGIGHNLAIAYGSLFAQMLRGNLSRLDAYHLNQPGLARYTQVMLTNGSHMYRAGNARKCNRRGIDEQSTITSYQHTVFVDGLDLKRIQVIQYNQVSDKTRSHDSTIIEPEILGCIIGSEANGLYGIQPQFDSTAYHGVDVPT